ncbi:MAG TPA: MarR family transcriptional regulator [Planctomycetota bacterium]|nr:MarR family transcriptional regulator [Planctomycetota bacterium]
MDEVIVRVLRTVACQTRLRILAHLLGVKEATPSQLARELGIELDLVSAHLARLAAAGLILRRRSGLRCFCIARSPYRDDALSGQVLAWLRDALRAESPTKSRTRPPESASVTAMAPPPQSHTVVFHAATAFTNLRRIQILRRLANSKPADVAALTRELRMSGAALGRHVRKLMRRGYVRVTRHRGRRLYQLARDGVTPLHARLLEVVAAHWGRQDLHS